MELNVTDKELGLILMGLYSGADRSLTIEEQTKYDTLIDRIEEMMVTSTRCNTMES